MKLEIIETRFRNFFCYGNKEITFKINSGINLVTGWNKDTESANGSGKTSLLDSVVFGLFGKTAKDVNLPQILSWKNKKDCECSITFKKDNDVYRIERGLKPNFLRLFLNNEEISQPSTKISFQEDIEKNILGFEFENFKSLIHCNPNNSISIFSTSKGQKRKFLEQLFGLETFSQLGEACKEKIALINIEIDDTKYKIRENLMRIGDSETFIINLESLLVKDITLQKELNILKEEYNLYNIKELNSLRLDINVGLSKVVLQEAVIFERTKKIETFITRKKSEYDLLKGMTTDVDFDEDKYNEYKDYLDKCNLSLKQKELSQLIELRDGYMNSIKVIDWEMKELEKTGSVYDTNKKHIEEKIALLSDEKCPTCQQKISKKVLNTEKDSLIEINKLIETNKNDLFEFATNKEGYSKSLDEVKTRIVDLRIDLDSIADIEKSFNKFQRLKEDKEYADLNKNKISKLLKQLEILNEKHSIFVFKKSKTSKLLDTSTKEQKAIVEKISQVNALFEKIKFYEGEIEKNKLAKTEADEQIFNMKNSIEEMKYNMKTYETKLESHVKLKEYLEFVRNLCRDEHIKQFAISNFIPHLNKRVNHYLSESGQNFYLKLNSLMEFDLKGPGIGENSSYGSLSGGESKIVDLAMQLSFLDIAKMQAQTFPNILILDEILDSSVDGNNISKLFALIELKQREDNSAVYIISHRPEIDTLNVNSTIKVVKENGFSNLNIL